MQKDKNIIVLLGISILLSLVSILVIYLIVDYKVKNITEKITNNILEIEYSKVGGKDNYEAINKIQMESIPKIIEKYNLEKNGSSQNPNNSQSTENKTPNKIQNNTISIFDTSKTIASKPVKKTKDGLYMLGNTEAKISFIEYSDLECPSCNQFHYSGIIEKLLETYPDKINFVFKHFPLNKHKQAFMEAEVAECVGEIGGADKFYPFVINTFANSKSTGDSYTQDSILELVSKLGVDNNKVRTCLETSQFKAKIEASIIEGKSIGINSTPTILIKDIKTGKLILLPGSLNIEDFKSKIDLLLK